MRQRNFRGVALCAVVLVLLWGAHAARAARCAGGCLFDLPLAVQQASPAQALGEPIADAEKNCGGCGPACTHGLCGDGCCQAGDQCVGGWCTGAVRNDESRTLSTGENSPTAADDPEMLVDCSSCGAACTGGPCGNGYCCAPGKKCCENGTCHECCSSSQCSGICPVCQGHACMDLCSPVEKPAPEPEKPAAAEPAAGVEGEMFVDCSTCGPYCAQGGTCGAGYCCAPGKNCCNGVCRECCTSADCPGLCPVCQGFTCFDPCSQGDKPRPSPEQPMAPPEASVDEPEVDCIQCGGPYCPGGNGSCGNGFCCRAGQQCVSGWCMPD